MFISLHKGFKLVLVCIHPKLAILFLCRSRQDGDVFVLLAAHQHCCYCRMLAAVLRLRFCNVGPFAPVTVDGKVQVVDKVTK